MATTENPKILIVDDIPANLMALDVLLKNVDAEVFKASSGNDALSEALQHDFALFLLDVQMPEMDGYELADILLGHNKTKDVPIIFITAAFRDEVNKLKGYAHGAIDYIEKPINNPILLAKVGIFLKLWRQKNQLNQLLEAIVEKNADLQTEIAERRKLETKLERLAMYDSLTNLPNRFCLKQESHKQLSAAKRYDHRIAFMFVDLDGFKAVNDNFGHEQGDAVLIEMSYRMVNALRNNDIVFRYGGDEFIIMLPDCKSNTDIETIGKRILQELHEPLNFLDIEEKLSASIGIAIYPENADTSDQLVSLADKAMYVAKQAGKNQLRFYTS